MRNRLALLTAAAAAQFTAPAAAQPACGGCPPAGSARFAPVIPPVFAGGGGGYVPLGGSAMPGAPGGYGPALPDPAALERLNLRTEWTAFVPVAGGADGFGTVQVADEAQIFVQTRAGLLVALDGVTGAKQWTYRYPAGGTAVFPVGWNDEFVFAVNVSRLLAFHRYTGVVAFDYEMPGSATAGPAADRELVYVTLNGFRVVGYRFPPALVAAARPVAGSGTAPPPNAAEIVARRYGAVAPAGGLRDEEFEAARVPFNRSTEVGLGANQRTPSISALPSVTPPYTLDNRGLYGTPSIAPIASLRQPYQFRPDYLRFNQQTPSISVLPPSVARVQELANFAPRGIEPTVTWTHLAVSRVAGNPVLTDRDAATDRVIDPPVRRVWLTTDGADVEAVDRQTGTTVVSSPLTGRVATPMAGPAALAADRVLGVVGLADGSVVALDLLRGGERGAKADWRATVGGLMNHQPVLTRDSVYASGDQSGVARIDIDTGDVVWKTDDTADRVLAVNGEYVYVRDRRGDLLVYDRLSPTLSPAGRTQPLARLPVQGFSFPVSNDRTDRILLVSESGAVLSLRDAAGKYARPTRLIPKVPTTAVKPADIPPEPKADAPPPMPEPKKDGA